MISVYKTKVVVMACIIRLLNPAVMTASTRMNAVVRACVNIMKLRSDYI